jgi:putative ABC transport system substrate-binding protein
VKRREFIAGLGSAAAWPVLARAQQGDRVRRIGVLVSGDENDLLYKFRLSAFMQALAGATCGWTFVGPAMTSIGHERSRRSLVGLQPDIIVTNGTPPTAALKRETRTIPIVFANVGDPAASGIVARLARPGGNITGFVQYENAMGGKWLELLSEIAPGLKVEGSCPLARCNPFPCILSRDRLPVMRLGG